MPSVTATITAGSVVEGSSTTTGPFSNEPVTTPKTKSRRLQPYEVTAYCACGGRMLSTGNGVSIGWSTQWPHRCDTCHATATYDTVYPHIVYKPYRKPK